MSKVIFIILGLVALGAVFTNPNQERHKEAIKNSLKKSLSGEKYEQEGKALMLDGAIVDGLIDNQVSTDNYIFFSTTKITWDGKPKIIGIGVLGNVYLSDKFEGGYCCFP